MTDNPDPATAIARLRELHEKATQRWDTQRGPWKCWDGYGPDEDGMMGIARIGPVGGTGIHPRSAVDIQSSVENAELVCASVNALPALLDVAEAARLLVAADIVGCITEPACGSCKACDLVEALARLR